MPDPRDEMIAELRAIAAQRTAEADAMRQDLVYLRRTLGAESALAEDNERLRARGVALAATLQRVRDALDDPRIDQRTGVDVGMRVLAALDDGAGEEAGDRG